MAEGIPSAVPFKEEKVMMGGSGRSLEDLANLWGRRKEHLSGSRRRLIDLAIVLVFFWQPLRKCFFGASKDN